MEEALKRSMAETSNTSWMRNNTEYMGLAELTKSLSQMDPGALIFATGSWGRQLDVKNTVF
eukprot:4408151-Pyramimonas_sp.AAC.1